VSDEARTVGELLQELTEHQHRVAVLSFLKEQLVPYMNQDDCEASKSLVTPDCIEEIVPQDVFMKVSSDLQDVLNDELLGVREIRRLRVQ